MMKNTFYVGTYTHDSQNPDGDAPGHRAEGIFRFSLDLESGRLEKLGSYASDPNPSFLALHPGGRFLYAVSEQENGGVSAYAVAPDTGDLRFINRQETGGADPCYVSVDPGGRWLMAANYTGGSLAVFPIGPDGELGPAAEFVQHEGSGPDLERQEKAHAHSIRLVPGSPFVLACDLGMDRVWVYRLDMETGKLTPNDPPGMEVEPGSGPRHFEFHPNRRWVYIANELGNTVTAAAWDGAAGTLAPLQTLPTLPEGFSDENTVADIHLTPDGRFLYVSNRGHDSLAAYRVDPESGRLAFLAHTHTQGRCPRNFAISPDGRFLLAANQFSGSLVVFRIDPDSGKLEQVGEPARLPSPVAVGF
ncbi:MAG: lactonase family protein [Chloroflexi bacterium]|nr:lactonase family protein [Chloroflexota bacterium]